MVLNFSYLAIKLPNFKPVDEKLPELEPRVSHSFDIKIVSSKTLLKVLAPPHPPKLTSGQIFLFQNLVLYMRYHNIFSLIESFTSDLSILLTISFWPFPSVSN